jgi:hypothetical protein
MVIAAASDLPPQTELERKGRTAAEPLTSSADVPVDTLPITASARVLRRVVPSLVVAELPTGRNSEMTTDRITETITLTEPPAAGDPHTVRIDFLFLDLTTCTRCRGTDHSLSEALTVVADGLQAAGIEVEVNKVHVATEEQARSWRFVSSPTIRVNGTDIALELRESSCGSQACTDGCGDQIACRVWVYHGQEYTEPPAAMIVDAILRQVHGPTTGPAPGHRYELPANLQRFFAGKALTRPAQSIPDAQPAEAADTGCCPPAEQETCCDTSAKADCCADAADQSCGCR